MTYAYRVILLMDCNTTAIMTDTVERIISLKTYSNNIETSIKNNCCAYEYEVKKYKKQSKNL